MEYEVTLESVLALQPYKELALNKHSRYPGGIITFNHPKIIKAAIGTDPLRRPFLNKDGLLQFALSNDTLQGRFLSDVYGDLLLNIPTRYLKELQEGDTRILMQPSGIEPNWRDATSANDFFLVYSTLTLSESPKPLEQCQDILSDLVAQSLPYFFEKKPAETLEYELTLTNLQTQQRVTLDTRVEASSKRIFAIFMQSG